METEQIVRKIIPLALTVILAVSIYKTIVAYILGKAVKGVIKETILLCLYIGAAPSLIMMIPNIGKYLVQPIENILNFVVSLFS